MLSLIRNLYLPLRAFLYSVRDFLSLIFLFGSSSDSDSSLFRSRSRSFLFPTVRCNVPYFPTFRNNVNIFLSSSTKLPLSERRFLFGVLGTQTWDQFLSVLFHLSLLEISSFWDLYGQMQLKSNLNFIIFIFHNWTTVFY